MKQFLKTSSILKEVLELVEERNQAYICVCISEIQDKHQIYTFFFGTKRFEELKKEVQSLICKRICAESFLLKLSGTWPAPEIAKEFRIMLIEMLIKEYESKGD